LHDPWHTLTSSAGFFAVPTPDSIPKASESSGGASAGPSITQAAASKTHPAATYSTLSPANDLPSLANNSPSPQISKLPAIVTIGTTTITANSNSEVTIGTQTLAPGSQVTVDNTIISYAPNGETLNIGGTNTQILAQSYVIGSTTLSTGAPAITISSHTYSLALGGSSIIIDGSTEPISSTQGSVSGLQKIWVQGYVVGDQTLIAGGTPITEAGTTMSLLPGGKSVVVIVEPITEDINVLFGSLGGVGSMGRGPSSDGAIPSSVAGVEQAGETSESAVPGNSDEAKEGGVRKSHGRKEEVRWWLNLWMALAFVIFVLREIS
jgi:hypothetical protein